MNLLEADGKAVLSSYGVPVPRGALWPATPAVGGGLVVKAQLPAGGRGKRGGIVFADDGERAAAAATSLLGTRIGGHLVERVYVEERIPIERELYLGLTIDRDRGHHVFIASPQGGVDIEEVGARGLLRLSVDPLLGLRSFHTARLARFLALTGRSAATLATVAEALYRLAIEEDAELVEINPLAVTRGGDLLACDAKIVLDDNAAFRHPDRAGFTVSSTATELERRITGAGAVGVEVNPEGNVFAVISGAGLMMATLDLLVGAGLPVRCVVDLGGTVLSGAEGLRAVLGAIAPAGPGTTFINAFMQTALCDLFARGLRDAQEAEPLPGRVVVRLNGRRGRQGRELLRPLGFEVFEDLRPAVAAVTGAGEG